MDENMEGNIQGDMPSQPEKKPIVKMIIAVIAIVAIVVIIGVVGVLIGGKTDPVARELALQQQASSIVATGDYAGCDAISDEMYHAVCINNIALNLAQETGDVSHCQKLDGNLLSIAGCERDILIPQIQQGKSIDICEGATTEESKNLCKDNFYMNTAIRENSPEICSSISDAQLSLVCEDTANVFGILQTGSIKDVNCDNLAYGPHKNECNLLKKGINSCSLLSSSLFNGLCQSGI